MRHVSCFTYHDSRQRLETSWEYHASRVTYPISCITYHDSRVTLHISCIFSIKKGRKIRRETERERRERGSEGGDEGMERGRVGRGVDVGGG